MRTRPLLLALALAGLTSQTPALAEIAGAKVERPGPDALSLSWSSPDAVDVYESDRPAPSLQTARLIAKGAREGYSVAHAGEVRRYFILVDAKDRTRVTTAERVIPLAQGSNFRDLGGYPAAGGRHVRWGLIYRSGGQPMLTAGDVAEIKAMGVTQLVDLRSSEERVLAPTRINGVAYSAVGYSMMDMMRAQGQTQFRNGVEVYRNMPSFLAPQMRIIFRSLLSGQTPLAYNCSAGQDRTGFASAMILSALGVPRETIIADYHLSTTYRRPEWEMPALDVASHPGDPVVALFAQYRTGSNWKTPQPLKDADGKPFLAGAFEAIDAKWGSVDAYLRQEIGLTAADIARLRQLYLE